VPARKLTVEAIILDPAGRALLVRQREKRHDWELPGGHVKKRESLAEAVVREVREETGLRVEPQRLVGIFYIRNQKVHDFIFICRVVGRRTKPRARPPEITACGYFAADALPQPIRAFTVDRVREALASVMQALPVELKSSQWL